MVADANLALAIALPVGIVALLAALILAAWMAGRRRRDRTDPLETVYPATHHALYGKSSHGSTATSTTADHSTNQSTDHSRDHTADVSDAASGEGDVTASNKSLRNPFKDIGPRSFKRKSYAEDSLWDTELDEVLDDHDWAPLEAGWRQPKLQRQQQRLQHAQMRRTQSNGGYASRPRHEGRAGDMPGTSSRMSTSERMVFGLAPGQTPAQTSGRTLQESRSQNGSGPRPYPYSSRTSQSGSAASHGSRSTSRPPPNVNGNSTSRGPGSVHGGASSSTLRSLGTVPEQATTVGPASVDENIQG